MKSTISSIEMLVSVALFSSAFGLFLYRTAAWHAASSAALSSMAGSLNASLQLQHAYFIMQYTKAQPNQSTGAVPGLPWIGAAATRFYPGYGPPRPSSPAGRIIAVGGYLYYLEVHQNESANES